MKDGSLRRERSIKCRALCAEVSRTSARKKCCDRAGHCSFWPPRPLSIEQEKTAQIKTGRRVWKSAGRSFFSASIASVCEDDAVQFLCARPAGDQKVFKFSPDGRLLAKFGQKGQGPGDFQSPGQIVFTPQGELAVARGPLSMSLSSKRTALSSAGSTSTAGLGLGYHWPRPVLRLGLAARGPAAGDG